MCKCNCSEPALLDNYVIVRTQSAGVFAGVQGPGGPSSMMSLTSVRRLWYWSGAASLSEMAVSGVKNPAKCKFSVVVPQQTVLGVIEVLSTTKEAQASIRGVAEWKA